MAEFSGGGLVAALLLFTALTVKDIYLGQNRGQNPTQKEETEGRGGFQAEQEHGRPAKTWNNPGSMGPVLRFQYCIS